MTADRSAAVEQRPVGRDAPTFPVEPPLTAGLPNAAPEDQRPLEVEYAYDAVDPAAFDTPVSPGLDRWAQLLPPLAGAGLGAGGTPLLSVPAIGDWADVEGSVYLKDESQNPTWSHKDRLNRPIVSAALRAEARGLVAASTGNHGASAAAHAARNDLPAVVLTVPGTPPAMEEFVRSHGAAIVQLREHDGLVSVVDALATRGFHPATSRTAVHTGHPYGPEGYKTIAYEIYCQLGSVPGTVLVPTAFAELLYGVWKGFRELDQLGLAEDTPAMIACEPGRQAAHVRARERGEPVVEIDAGESDAHSIGGATSTHRGYLALEASDGRAVAVPETTIAEAQRRLSARGRWQEFSAAAAAGGLAVLDSVEAPVVVLGCSSGYKDGTDWSAPRVAGTVEAVAGAVADEYGLDLSPRRP